MKKIVKNLQINSSYFMRLISLTIMLALIAPVMINAQAGKVNFTGTWALNAEKSTQPQGGGQGGGMRMGGGNFVAKQEANLLTVDRTRTNQNGEATTTTSKYTLDGKESINTTPRGESKSVATWSADGKTLNIATTRTTQNGEMKTTEAWTLTDANTITVVSKFTTPNGDMTTTMVYDKK
jgi:hypothetical protein